MRKTLIITSSPRKDSISTALAKSFASNLKDREITFVDLSRMIFPKYTEELIDMIDGKIPEEPGNADKAFYDALHDQFVAADEYVIAFPNWNLICPPELISYILCAMRAGSTFKYTDQGSVGLLENRKVLLIGAAGGMYTPFLTDFGVDWLKEAFNMMGVTKQYVVMAEGVEMPPFDPELIKKNGAARLLEIAEIF